MRRGMTRVWIVLLAGCGTSLPGGVDSGIAMRCTGAQPTLAADVAPILRGCSGEMCHGFALQSAANARAFLVGQPTTQCDDHRLRVAPGDPEHSYLLDKLTATNMCTGAAMPKAFNGGWHPLAADALQSVYDWVCAGAN